MRNNCRPFGTRNRTDAGISTHEGQFRFRAALGNEVSYSGPILNSHAPHSADMCALLTNPVTQVTILAQVLQDGVTGCLRPASSRHRVRETLTTPRDRPSAATAPPQFPVRNNTASRLLAITRHHCTESLDPRLRCLAGRGDRGADRHAFYPGSGRDRTVALHSSPCRSAHIMRASLTTMMPR
jgi:hypothetical protein